MSNNNLKVFESTLELVSGIWPTPLVKLRSFGDVWAKLEFFNTLSGSVKDRIIWYMFEKYLKEKDISIVEEASSGNVAIAVGLLCNILGIKYRAYVPKNVNKITEVLLKIIGVDIVKTNYETIDREFWTWVYEHAKSIQAFNFNQFENYYNPEAHYYTTGKEISEQLKIINKKPQILITGVGTGGHITGISKRLRNEFRELIVIGVEPEKDDNIPGIKRIDTGTLWVDEVVNEVISISLKDSIKGVIELSRKEGLLVGLSSGAVFSAYKRAREYYGDKTYVLVFPDSIFKYIDILEKYSQLYE